MGGICPWAAFARGRHLPVGGICPWAAFARGRHLPVGHLSVGICPWSFVRGHLLMGICFPWPVFPGDVVDLSKYENIFENLQDDQLFQYGECFWFNVVDFVVTQVSKKI